MWKIQQLRFSIHSFNLYCQNTDERYSFKKNISVIIHSTKYSFKEQMRYWPGLPTSTPVQDLMAGQKPPAPAFVKLLFELFSFSNFHPVNTRWHFTCAVHINQRLKEEGGFILQWLHIWHIYTGRVLLKIGYLHTHTPVTFLMVGRISQNYILKHL